MLVKFFARGKGCGRGPVEYITRKNYPDTNLLREPAPSVLRGNPDITRKLIDGLEFKHKYRSGVLSFAPEDAPTDRQIEAVIDSFEEYAFAGLDKDAYNILWVKHTHTGDNRVELHFVTPRVELYTGKSLNIAPPGWHGYFKPWQTSWNISQGWSRPDDPARQRLYEPGYMALINADREAKGLEPIADTRKLLTEYVMERVTAGLITGRDDIIDLFKEELGLEITRAGFDYITVKDPETEKRYRLKGKLYEREREFRPEFQATTEISSGTTGNSTTNSQELQAVRERIRSNYQYRYQYHQKRYGASKFGSELDAGQVLAHTSDGGVEPLSGYLRRKLGSHAILIESDKRKAEDVRLSRREARFWGNRVETATTDPRFITGVNRGDNYQPNRQRDISDPPDQLDSEQGLAMSGKTLSEIGTLKDISIPLDGTATHIDDERIRKQIDDRPTRASRAVQTGYDEFVPQIQYGHEAAGEAEQAASYSSDGFKQTSEGLERANREVEFIQQQTNLNFPRIRGNLTKKRAKELEKFKTEINLVEYAIHIGYEYLARESSPSSAVLRHSSGDKIIVATDKFGHGIYFSVGDNSDNGTIIDFVQNRNNLSLGEVRRELRPYLVKSEIASNGGIKPHRPDELVAKPHIVNRDRISLIKKFSGFSAPMSHSYLAQRGITSSTVNNDRFTNRIAIDSQENIIFPHYDRDGLTGYSIKNINFTGFSKGGTKALWQSNQSKDDTRLVITESAIDALSYHQLFPHQHTRYISTEGTPSNYQKQLIVEAMAEPSNTIGEIIIATDNDEAGNKLAHTLAALAPSGTSVQRHAPTSGKDWNECLERQTQLTRSSLQKPKPKQNRRNQLEL
jgi:hypothetical protein